MKSNREKPRAKGAKFMERREVIDPRFVRTINHPTRVEIVVECTLAPISESEFRAKRKGQYTRQSIKNHFKILLDCGAIEVVATERIQGGLTYFYGSSKGAMFSERDFDRLPDSLKGNMSAMVIQSWMTRAKESLLAGTLDSYPERHLTWMPLDLDRQGFMELMEKMDQLFDWMEGPLKEEARERLESSGEAPIHTTAAMSGFESPAPDRDHTPDS